MNTHICKITKGMTIILKMCIRKAISFTKHLLKHRYTIHIKGMRQKHNLKYRWFLIIGKSSHA